VLQWVAIEVTLKIRFIPATQAAQKAFQALLHLLTFLELKNDLSLLKNKVADGLLPEELSLLELRALHLP